MVYLSDNINLSTIMSTSLILRIILSSEYDVSFI